MEDLLHHVPALKAHRIWHSPSGPSRNPDTPPPKLDSQTPIAIYNLLETQFPELLLLFIWRAEEHINQTAGKFRKLNRNKSVLIGRWLFIPAVKKVGEITSQKMEVGQVLELIKRVCCKCLMKWCCGKKWCRSPPPPPPRRLISKWDKVSCRRTSCAGCLSSKP